MPPPKGSWARAVPLDGIAASAGRTSAIVRGKSRLVDRSFDLSANSFTSLRFAVVHRTAAVAKSVNKSNEKKDPS